MKNLLPLILLITFFLQVNIIYSQDTELSVPVARAYLSVIKQQDIQFQEQVDLIREEIINKIYPTKDAKLILEAQAYLSKLEAMPMPVSWNLKTDYIELVDKKKFKISNDKFNESVEIYHKKTGFSYPFTLRLIEQKGILYLLLDVRLSTYDWVFANDVFVLVDGEKYTLNFEGAERDVISGNRIAESKTFFLDENMVQMIENISYSESDTDIRFSGKRNYDTKLTKKINPIFREILDLVYNIIETD